MIHDWMNKINMLFSKVFINTECGILKVVARKDTNFYWFCQVLTVPHSYNNHDDENVCFVACKSFEVFELIKALMLLQKVFTHDMSSNTNLSIHSLYALQV